MSLSPLLSFSAQLLRLADHVAHDAALRAEEEERKRVIAERARTATLSRQAAAQARRRQQVLHAMRNGAWHRINRIVAAIDGLNEHQVRNILLALIDEKRAESRRDGPRRVLYRIT